MKKTLAALETEVRSHLDELPPAARARWSTLRVIRAVVRTVGQVASAATAFAVFANTAPPLLGVLVGGAVLSAGLLVTRTLGGWLTLIAVKDAVRALEAQSALPSVGGSTSVALPAPRPQSSSPPRRAPTPRPRRERSEPVDTDARDFDDAG